MESKLRWSSGLLLLDAGACSNGATTGFRGGVRVGGEQGWRGEEKGGGVAGEKGGGARARARVADKFYRAAAQPWSSHRRPIDQVLYVACMDELPYRKKEERLSLIGKMGLRRDWARDDLLRFGRKRGQKGRMSFALSPSL
jgi:hypothetical protein